MKTVTKTEMREQFKILESTAYLNHAATGLVPKDTYSAIQKYLSERCLIGPEYDKDKSIIEKARLAIAKFLGCKAREIAFVSNTSSGISKIAQGIKLSPGDGIACLVPDFPSNIYPWMWQKNRGLDVYFIHVGVEEFSIQKLRSEIKKNTRLVTLSHVNYLSGFRFPLEEINHCLKKEGIFVFVDMIQSLGTFPVDLNNLQIDFMSAGSHKWLMGLPGAGILYIREELIPLISPNELGWKSVKHEEEFHRIELDLKEDATVLEPGTMNTIGILSLQKGIELLNDYGIENVSKEILEWNNQMAKELKFMGYNVISPYGNEFSSGILSFGCEDPKSLYELLLKEGIKVSLRERFIRLSPHFYNNEYDLERTLRLLGDYKLTKK